MYISDTYWDHWIGDTDDSLTLVEYLAGKQKGHISFGELFSEIGLDRLNGDFRQHEEPLAVAWTPEEHKLLNEALKDFVSDPMAYDLSEMESEEDMLELAGVCEALRKELYG